MASTEFSEFDDKEKIQIKKWKIVLLSVFIVIESTYWFSLPHLAYLCGSHIPFMSNSGLVLLLLNLRIYIFGFMALMPFVFLVFIGIIFFIQLKTLRLYTRILYGLFVAGLIFLLFLIFINGPGLPPKRDVQYMKGFLTVIQREVDIPAVREWMMTIEFPQEEGSSRKIDLEAAPDFIKKLNPNNIMVSHGSYFHKDPSLEIVTFHFGLSSANLTIGPIQMEIPEYFKREKTIVAIYVEPGAYVFSPGAR